MTADETTAQTAGVDVEMVLAEAACPECGHLILRFHTSYDCDYHNRCECSLTSITALAAALAPLLAAAEQKGRDEQAAAVEAVLDRDGFIIQRPGTKYDRTRVVRATDLRAVLSPNTDAALSKVPEATTVTEWGVQYANGIVSAARWSREGNEQEVARVALCAAAPAVAANYALLHPATVVSRQRTAYAEHVTDWQPADTEGGDDA